MFGYVSPWLHTEAIIYTNATAAVAEIDFCYNNNYYSCSAFLSLFSNLWQHAKRKVTEANLIYHDVANSVLSTFIENINYQPEYYILDTINYQPEYYILDTINYQPEYYILDTINYQPEHYI